MYTVSLDISMRCSGIVILNEDGDLVDYTLVTSKKITDEELLDYNVNVILEFLKPYKGKISNFVIEGLAFMGKCKRKDLIDGNYWLIRYFLYKEFGDTVEYDIYTVAQWRKSVISKERAKEIKDAGEDKKGWQKIECVDKLPEDIRETFGKYVKENKHKKDAIYDLTDAFFLGKFKLLN